MSARSSLPAWARPVLRVVPRDRRADVEADLDELYRDRRGRYGRLYAQRRLCGDLTSLWRGRRRGGSMLQDMRFALRLFRRHPVPVGIAVGGLAIAIGVVTSVFSLINASLLRPFGMDDPTTVVTVARQLRGHGRPWLHFPYPDFQRMRTDASLCRPEAMLKAKARVGIAAGDGTESPRRITFVSGSYLQTFGGRPAIGRALIAADDEPGAPPVVVASHQYWSARLQSDPAAIGRTLWLNDEPFTLVGVLRPDFTGPTDFGPSIWAPLATAEAAHVGSTPTELVEVVARIAPGATMRSAQDNLSAVLHSEPGAPDAHRSGQVMLYSSTSPIDGPDNAESYIVVASTFAITGLVLLLACANTANLLLAGASTRVREIGVRLALGSTAGRLVRQLLTESLLLGAIAGGLGLVLALWCAPVLASIVGLPAETITSIDVRVLGFTIVVALLCGLGAGLSPARYAARSDMLGLTKSQAGRSGRAQRGSRLRTSFIGLQAAVSALLLVTAALLARTAIATARTDVGFDIDKVLAITLPSPWRQGDQAAYLDAALAAMRALPAIESASVSQTFPFGPIGHRNQLEIAGRSFELHIVDSDASYFSTMGMRLLRGRTFTTEEVANQAAVALISDSVARAFFAGQDPIGQPASRIPGEGRVREPAVIIGVVADAIIGRIDAQEIGALYRPIARKTVNPPSLLIRAAEPRVAAGAVEAALRRVDSRVTTRSWIVKDGLENYVGLRRMLASLAVPIAMLAVVLATLGVYGVTTFLIGQRTHEVSVRMAMGANAFSVFRLLVIDGLRSTIIGLVIGLGAALVVNRLMASELLSFVSPYDPLAIGVAVITLLGSALAAVVVPARRAARIEPADVLRRA